MLDLWERLHGIFDNHHDGHPEIEINKLTPKSVLAIVDYLLVSSKNIETAFTVRHPFQQVIITSPDVIGKFVASGAVIGEFWLSIMIEHFALPEVAIFIDGPDYMSLEYRMSDAWNPVTLIGMFEFLRMIKQLEPNVVISLSPEFFARSWRQTFDITFQEYLNDSI